MTYTLILIAALMPNYGQAGASVDSTHVPGFASYTDCVNAGDQIPSPPSNPRFDGYAKFVCVPMGEK